jgi:hypothetical protein
MKATGFLLMLAGWGLVLAALALLKPDGPRAAFVLAGVGVEGLGLALLVGSHLTPRRNRR